MSNGDWEGLLVGLGFFAVVGLLIAVMVFREGSRTRRNASVWVEIAKQLGLVASGGGVTGHWQDIEVSAEYKGGELFVRANTRLKIAGSYTGSSGQVMALEEGPARVEQAVRETMQKATDWNVGFHHGMLTMSRKTLTVDSNVCDAIRLAAEACARIDAQQNYREA
jgi:hypothetical protein